MSHLFVDFLVSLKNSSLEMTYTSSNYYKTLLMTAPHMFVSLPEDIITITITIIIIIIDIVKIE